MTLKKSFFFNVDHFKIFIEFFRIFLQFYDLVFRSQDMWDVSSPIRDQAHTPWTGRWNLNHCTMKAPRQLPLRCFYYLSIFCYTVSPSKYQFLKHRHMDLGIYLCFYFSNAILKSIYFFHFCRQWKSLYTTRNDINAKCLLEAHIPNQEDGKFHGWEAQASTE